MSSSENIHIVVLRLSNISLYYSSGKCRTAAGYFNDGNFNNEGSNGYYWSSRLNSSNPNNAFQLNFNSDNVNMNNNERQYGYPVRGVLSILF